MWIVSVAAAGLKVRFASCPIFPLLYVTGGLPLPCIHLPFFPRAITRLSLIKIASLFKFLAFANINYTEINLNGHLQTATLCNSQVGHYTIASSLFFL